jgi:selenium donor protein
VDDLEPKFGLAVSGVVHPDKVITNSHSQPGDVLILTKPIGTGIISTALKQGFISEAEAQPVIKSMSTLNRIAAEAMQEVGVHACTDVTGFGLLGHLLGMMKGAKISAIIEAGSVPVFDHVLEQVTAGIIPGGTKNNFEYTAPFVGYSEKISQSMKMILNDAQTSGGLLIAVAKEKGDDLLKLLHQNGIISASKIGTVVELKKQLIIIK